MHCNKRPYYKSKRRKTIKKGTSKLSSKKSSRAQILSKTVLQPNRKKFDLNGTKIPIAGKLIQKRSHQFPLPQRSEGKLLCKEKIIPLRNGGKSYTELNPVTPIEYLKLYANADKVPLPRSSMSYTLINPVFSVEILKTYANVDGDEYEHTSETDLLQRESKDFVGQDEVPRGDMMDEKTDILRVLPNEHGDEMNIDKNKSYEDVMNSKSSIEVISKRSETLEAGDSSVNLRSNETRSETVFTPRKTRIPIRMKRPCR